MTTTTTMAELNDEFERYVTAHHEANHLVLSELLLPGITRGATIIPDYCVSGSLGSASIPSVAERRTEKLQAATLADAVCSVGGDLDAIVNAIDVGPEWWGDVRDDMEMARDILEQAFGADRLDDALASAVYLAGRFLSWTAVTRVRDAIQDALLERGMLIGNQVDEVIGSAQPSRFYALCNRAERWVDRECERLQQGSMQ